MKPRINAFYLEVILPHIIVRKIFAEHYRLWPISHYTLFPYEPLEHTHTTLKPYIIHETV